MTCSIDAEHGFAVFLKRRVLGLLIIEAEGEFALLGHEADDLAVFDAVVLEDGGELIGGGVGEIIVQTFVKSEK